MSLTPAQRVRYARHLLLPELGEAGQARLLGSRVHPDARAEAGARAVARLYLERAGVTVDDTEGEPGLTVPDSARVTALAGSPQFHEAARALAGAFAAVETIKSLTGLGHPSELPDGLSLDAEDA